MSLSVFAEHKQHVETMDRRSWLGFVTWYSVSTTVIPHETVWSILDGVGLGHIAPRKPADSDVFRRVFERGVRREFNTDLRDVTENLLIREVSSTPERIVRRIVREVVDSKGETLDYAELVNMTFNKSHPDRITLEHLGAYHSNGWNLAEELAGRYRQERGCLNGKGIRDLIRRGLAECKATSLRDAVFFIMESYAEKLDALERIANLMPGTEFHSLPLLDDRKQRDAIRRAFESEAAEELDKLAVEIDASITAGNCTPEAFERFQGRFQPTRDKAKEYSELLEDEIGLETLRIQLVQGKLQQMFMKGLDAG